MIIFAMDIRFYELKNKKTVLKGASWRKDEVEGGEEEGEVGGGVDGGAIFLRELLLG